jgi:phosphatidylglycerophosphate synthase
MTEATNDFASNLSRLRSAQKPSFGTAAYGRYVNRPAGRLVAAFAHSFGLTPNGATAISATLSATGIALLAIAKPSLWAGLGVAVLLAAGYVMDSVDGQLARLRGGGSVRGEWLDHTIDSFKESSIHLAVAISWYRYPPADDRAWLLVPLGFSVVQSVTYFGIILLPFLRAANSTPKAPPVRHEHPLRKWLILPTDYGFMCWTFALIAVPTLFLGVYTTLFVLAAAMLALALRKWWGELGALDQAKRASRPAS